MSTQQFIHLHLHTEYSIADGLSRIPELVARTRSVLRRAHRPEEEKSDDTVLVHGELKIESVV